jgi:hypothetical protein
MEKPCYITYTRAKKEFYLSDKDLESMVCKEANNPHYKCASPMKLYLLSDIQEAYDYIKTCGILQKRIESREKRSDAAKKRIERQQEFAKQEQNERRSELQQMLKAYNCTLRNDSKLCSDYIDNNIGNKYHIAQVMNEMKFYFEHTDYKNLMKKDRDSEYCKSIALDKWIMKQSIDPDDDYPFRNTPLPFSLYEDAKYILTQQKFLTWANSFCKNNKIKIEEYDLLNMFDDNNHDYEKCSEILTEMMKSQHFIESCQSQIHQLISLLNSTYPKFLPFQHYMKFIIIEKAKLYGYPSDIIITKIIEKLDEEYKDIDCTYHKNNKKKHCNICNQQLSDMDKHLQKEHNINIKQSIKNSIKLAYGVS